MEKNVPSHQPVHISKDPNGPMEVRSLTFSRAKKKATLSRGRVDPDVRATTRCGVAAWQGAAGKASEKRVPNSKAPVSWKITGFSGKIEPENSETMDLIYPTKSRFSGGCSLM